MIFEFKILGLILMFVLIISNFYKNLKESISDNIYSKILYVGYLTNFLYLLTYIFIKNNNNLFNIFIILYLFSLIVLSSLFNINTIDIVLKDKYKLKETTYNKKMHLINIVNTMINIILLIIISILPFSLNDNIISGLSIKFTLMILSIYSIIGLITTIISNIVIDKRKKIIINYLIIISGIIIQHNFNDINVIDPCYIISIIYMYLNLNNADNKDLEKIKIENDSVVKASNELKKFLSNMSYEIRTPLNTIDGLSQVIESSDDINSIKDDVKDIRTASKDLIDIINGIIDISTIESGQMKIINDNYDTSTLFDNIKTIVNSRLKEKDVKFKIDISKNIPNTLNGDADRIEQILINILMNSIKFTNKGHIMLKVEAINSQSMCRLKMTVSDTGKGIKKDEIKNIFTRDNNGKLGLVIVKKLIDLMNGKIDIESTYNKGTTIVVTIDQKIVNILNETGEEIQKKKKIDVFNLSNKRILIVDDNKLNLKVASKLLSLYKANITTLSSGEECLETISSDNKFDLILIDDLMPNMTGSEVLDTLLKIERVEGFHIPVVVLTANAMSGMRERYISLGFDDFLAKPIDKYELNRILKKFLKK